jgi:putative endonuclease
MTVRAETGMAGESLAAGYLVSRGYRLIERNWRCRSGEIDLVMLDGDVVVFVEVKTRRNRVAGTAEESVSPQKGNKLLATGEWYIADHPEFRDSFWRIDILAITMGPDGGASRVTHLQNAVTAG